MANGKISEGLTTITTQLHHESSIGRGSDTASSEIDDRKTLQTGSFLEEVVGCRDLLRIGVKLFIAHNTGLADLTHNCTLMSHRFDNVTSTSLALSANHCCSFGNATESLAEIPSATDIGHFEIVLVDVVLIVCGSEHLGLVNIINSDGLQDLSE